MEEVTGELVGQGWQDPWEYMERAGGLESRACLGWAKLDMEPKVLRLGTWGSDRAVLLPASRGSVHGQGWTPALPLSLGPPSHCHSWWMWVPPQVSSQTPGTLKQSAAPGAHSGLGLCLSLSATSHVWNWLEGRTEPLRGFEQGF